MAVTGHYADLETIRAAIARSRIVVARSLARRAAERRFFSLPTGFDEADVAVLEWIAAEASRTSRHYLPI
jgi:hypothetical protein